MKRLRMRSAVVALMALLLTATAVAGAQGSANLGMLPPTSRVHGLTYGEWGARWWEFAFSIPATQNPLAGSPDCAHKRLGNVELLIGNAAQVTCEVPVGTMLFVEVLAVECSNLEEGTVFYGSNEQELRTCAESFVPQGLKATIDGVEVRGVEKYRKTSPLIEFTLSADNILGKPAGTAGIAVSNSTFLMIGPLKPGKHTIDVQGTYHVLDYARDVHFDVNVTRKR